MELTRFYCANLKGSAAELMGPEAHHAASVKRLSAGDKVELFDGHGKLAKALITSVSRKKTQLRIEHLTTAKKRDHSRIVIAASVAKGQRFDWLIGKCTELGIDRVVPIIFDRTVKQPKNAKIVERWENLAISACKQCRSLWIPKIDPPTKLAAALEMLNKDYPKAKILFGSLTSRKNSIAKLDTADNDIIAFTGPEGGLTRQEEKFMADSGAKPLTITKNVLRAETAAIVIAAILAAKRDATDE